MKHIIETKKAVSGLKTWSTTAKKYKVMDVVLMAQMQGTMRSGNYAKYLIIGKDKNKIYLREVKI